jgi:hypothetical protein
MKTTALRLPLSIIIACVLGLLTVIHYASADEISAEVNYEQSIGLIKDDIRGEVVAEYTDNPSDLIGLEDALDSFEAKELLKEIAEAEAEMVN